MTCDTTRDQFTKIGCIMEDASVTALLWKETDGLSPADRLVQLKAANQEISILLEQIETQLADDV